MMDIGKYFSSSKKRNLSDSSKEDKDPKNAREAHQATVTKTTMFLKKVWTFQTIEVFFLKSSKNVESKVNEIFANTNTLKENKIKDEKQLAELTETVNFLSEKFHKL